MYKKKVAPAPTTTKASKNMKHVSFAEPLVSFLGESIKVASEPPFQILEVPCHDNPTDNFDPMLHEFLIHVDQGDHSKKATKTADQELLKERKSGDILVQDKGAMASTDPLQDLLVSSFCSGTVAEMEDINVVTSPPSDSPMNTTKFFNTSQVDGFTTPSPSLIDPTVLVEGQEVLGDLNSLININPGPSEVALQLVTPLLDSLTTPRPEHAENANHDIQNQTPIVEEHVQSGNENGLLNNCPVDLFLASISTEVDQPLLPDPATLNNPQPQPKFKSHRVASSVTKRKSVRLTAKAQSRIGKDTIQIAQDLLVKKLGELSPDNQAANIPNIESLSQHLDQPLTKNNMEALQVLVEHGAKKMKKGSNPRNQGPATRMEVA